MAFLRKVGNIMERAMATHVTQKISSPKQSIFQAIRCMSTSKLFVGGLSYSTDDTSLTEAFSRYGEVAEARVIVDRDTGRSRGFGFVTYSSAEEASAAIQALDQQDLHGRRVRVNFANDRPRSFGGGYGGGNFGGGGGYGGGNFGGGGGDFGGNYGSGGGYNNSGNYGGGGYGNAGGYGSGNNSGINNFNGGNLNSGSDGQNYGVAGGVGGSDAGSDFTPYGGFGDKFGNEHSHQTGGQAEDFSQNDPSDGSYRDEDDTPGNYADRRG